MTARAESPLGAVGPLFDECAAILAERAETHGDLGASYRQVAALWSARLGVRVRPSDVAFCLSDLKYVRHRFNPNHRDNAVDGVNYTAIGFTILDDSLDDPANPSSKSSR